MKHACQNVMWFVSTYGPTSPWTYIELDVFRRRLKQIQEHQMYDPLVLEELHGLTNQALNNRSFAAVDQVVQKIKSLVPYNELDRQKLLLQEQIENDTKERAAEALHARDREIVQMVLEQIVEVPEPSVQPVQPPEQYVETKIIVAKEVDQELRERHRNHAA